MLLNKAKTFDLKKPTKKTVDVEHQNSKQNKNITIRDICSLTKKITCINNENMFNQRSTDTVIKKKSTRSKYRIQSSSSSDDEDVVGVKYNKKTIPLDATTEEIDETCISSHDSLMETQESIVVMERRDIILTAVFGTFGAISIFIGLCLAAWRYLRDKRSKDLISDCDNGIDSENIVSVEESQQYYKKNGLLNFKTPLITSKTVGGTSSPGSKSPAAGSCSPGGGTTMSSGINDAKSPTVAQPAKQTHNVKDNSPKAFLQSRSDSLVDMYIDNTEPSENVGQIHFSLEYDYQNTTLILRIIQGKDLPAKDLSGTSDPYVRVTLLPDKKHRLETKIKRRTLNPRWNETLYFEGFPIQKLQSRVLHLHVFDYDRFSRDDSIGEMFLPLCQVDFSDKPSFWKALKPPAKDKCGELLCSLCYHPSNSVLTLTLLKARNLKAKDINGKSDPYVKVWLQFGDKRIEKRKTPIFKCTLNPVFNEAFSFNVPWEKIRECSLDVMVMDFDNIGRNELIGRIQLAGKNGSGASETKHWQDMITKPRQTIVQWHRLKPE